jgi:hypothetical protein
VNWIIKVLLVIAVVLITGALARGGGARRLALRRLGLAVFALVVVASILYPNAWTRVARLVGVGRGADLLLYMLIVAVLALVATRFARDRRVQQQLTALARRVALAEAVPPTAPPASGEVPVPPGRPASGAERPGTGGGATS